MKLISVRKLAGFLKHWDHDFDPLFVCGVAGSGTTLLSGLLDQRYRNAGCLHESALMMSVKSALRVKRVGSYGNLSAYYSGIFIPNSISNGEIRDSILELYRRVTRYPKESRIVIDKAPNVHLVRTPRLKAAFPSSKVLLIFRNPVTNIEGLRRKWPDVFGQADLNEVCDFWQSVHEIFLQDTKDFRLDVMGVSYERLTRYTKEVLDRLARFCKLQPRKRALEYPSKPDLPGKGLRNVVNGQIEIVRESIPPDMWCLSEAECIHINERLMGLHDKLDRLCTEHLLLGLNTAQSLFEV